MFRPSGLTTYDAKDPDTSFPPIEPVRPPESAPNVLIVLLDDVGFGASSVFGGPCNTPTCERLAEDGLRYNRFHTTACAPLPRRASDRSKPPLRRHGRDHRGSHFGSRQQLAAANTKAPLADILRMNGYSTAQLGKCHEVPVWQTARWGSSTCGPRGRASNTSTASSAVRTISGIPPLRGHDARGAGEEPEEGYHLTEDLADRAIAWVGQQKALMPDKPFFMYFAPGATHAPHHVPAEWIDKYRGQFDDGWDRLRERTFARQRELGVIPEDAELTPRHEEIPAWDDMPDALKPVLARQMEVYAAFLEHVDHHVGRLVDAVEALGALDDTLIYVIVGDNGASAEGTLNGAFNEMANFNGMAELETTEFMVQTMDKLGTPEAYNHYSVGWAHAMNTPYQWTKQVASHWGGTRNGTIVRWPKGIAARGEVRSQFSHVIDVCPTVLEAAGLPHPVMVNGVQQAPIEGTSMLYSFDDGEAPERHDLQYFEMFANRGIYHKGWSAVTKHRTPWVMGEAKLPAFDDDVWELYDGSKDWTQAHDLAKEMPEKLHQLQRLWLIEATKYNVLPLDDRTAERLNADIAGRPQLVRGTSQMLFAGMGRLSESSVLNTKADAVGRAPESAAAHGPRLQSACPSGSRPRLCSAAWRMRSVLLPSRHGGTVTYKHGCT